VIWGLKDVGAPSADHDPAEAVIGADEAQRIAANIRKLPDAAMQRIEAVRRILPFCFFNEETTEAGIACLGYYHEKKDEQRHVGLGPEHDFSSHAADSFGLMAICYEGPDGPQTIDELFERQLQYADATRSEITGY